MNNIKVYKFLHKAKLLTSLPEVWNKFHRVTELCLRKNNIYGYHECIKAIRKSLG